MPMMTGQFNMFAAPTAMLQYSPAILNALQQQHQQRIAALSKKVRRSFEGNIFQQKMTEHPKITCYF
jgi:hypothetical protein